MDNDVASYRPAISFPKMVTIHKSFISHNGHDTHIVKLHMYIVVNPSTYIYTFQCLLICSLEVDQHIYYVRIHILAL